MILVGYSADFFTWVWKEICHAPDQFNMNLRIGILIPALILFILAAAIYMQRDMEQHRMMQYLF